MKNTHILLLVFCCVFGLTHLNISPIYYLNCFLLISALENALKNVPNLAQYNL